jgi:hypothetical protein
MSNAFQSAGGGACFPRNTQEWQEKGMAPELAEHRMKQEVFGHDYRVDAKGNPIEQGKGSAQQQTAHHKQALEKIAAARRSAVGFTGALDGAFDPKKG